MKSIKQTWGKLSRGAKASVAFFFANIVTKGIIYITTPLYTRLLTPEEYGQATLFFTWVEVLGIVAMFCLHYGVFNNGMLDYPEERGEYSFSMLALSNVITLGFTVVLLCLYPVLKTVLDMELPLLLLMCALFLFQPAFNFFVARQRYELQYKETVIWTVVGRPRASFAVPNSLSVMAAGSVTAVTCRLTTVTGTACVTVL